LTEIYNKMAKYKITLNRDECIGCGACTNFENYELDDENKAIIKNSEVENIGTNKEAEDICPVDTINIEEV
jgi:ferredoxin